MADVLKITKQDKTVHVLPVSNKAFWLGYNKRMPTDRKVKIEVIDEEEAKGLPFYDKSHVSASDALAKLDILEKEGKQKDELIEKLQAQLAASNKTAPTASATDMIEKIKAATNADEIRLLMEGEERKTVTDAANKRIAELTASN
ncbi:hypothetical protein QTN47_17055 [Danxiaibacter flavus]|uniref:Uncharacterized protein n=1 Tax=Danxiaibacter flavus TaxID=3049108 RepID=A0ABV3ZJF4_9BACT|nr:hypothetical protein QNM32_17065 [Chitinophagaceae bacterium DXS]